MPPAEPALTPLPTLRLLLEDRALNLRAWIRPADLDRTIGWVHTSELADPAPFLEGGELLLTTGLTLPDDAPGRRAYVTRLVDAGVAGLGFGTGLTHAEVPAAVLAAAQESGLPLIAVPKDTAFIAVSKVVSHAISAARYTEVTQLNDAQHLLTRAALRQDGFATLVRRLAALLGAWVVLTDASGTAVQVSPATARTRLPGLRDDLNRLTHQRPPTSLTISAEDGEVTLQSLGSGRVRGLLAVGKAAGLTAANRQVINTAASLLTLGMEQSRALDGVRDQLQTVVVELLLAGQVTAAQQAARSLFGGLPAEPVHVIAALGSSPFLSAAGLALEGRHDSALLHGQVDQVLIVVAVEPDQVAVLLSELPGAGAVGVSGAGTLAELPELYAHATQAARAAQRTGTTLMRFADLAAEGLLRLVPRGEALAFAAALLAPVLAHDAQGRGDLVRSLRAWLESNGQWDPAASLLGVHRHTLRNRMARVEGLLGRSLDSVDLRCELWLALALLDGAAQR